MVLAVFIYLPGNSAKYSVPNMAAPYGSVKKCIACIILLHFGVISLCQLILASEEEVLYMFSPNDIAAVTKHSCMVALNQRILVGQTETEEEATKTGLFFQLKSAFKSEENVVIGMVKFEHFEWPSKRAIKDENLMEISDLNQHDLAVFLFQKPDRTCLSTIGLQHTDPKVALFTGMLNLNVVIQFVNEKCNTFRKYDGSLTMEGLHRWEILNTLFHVENNLRSPSMTNLSLYLRGAINSELETCDKDLCSNRGDQEELKMNDMFKKQELPIAKCDKIEMPSKNEFFHDFLKISKPVIIKNAINDWPALKKWSNHFLKSQYGMQKVHIKLTPQGEFEGVDKASNFKNYKSFSIPEFVKEQLLFPDLVVVRPATANMNFSKFLDLVSSVSNGSKKNFSAYLEYSSLSDIIPELEDDIEELPLLKDYLELKHQNIWLSDGNTLGKLHFDPFDNFLCQVFHKTNLKHTVTALQIYGVFKVFICCHTTSHEFVNILSFSCK